MNYTYTEEREVIDAYIESLDSEGPVTVCGMHYDVSNILKNVDPIAYSCGFNDFVSYLQSDNEISEELANEACIEVS